MLDWLMKLLPFSPEKRSLRSAEASDEDANHKSCGNQYLMQDDWSQAEDSYRQSLAIFPDDAEVHLNLGFALKEQKRYQEAQTCVERAVAIDPAVADAYYILGLLSQAQGDVQGAVRNFGKTLEINATFEPARHDLCMVLFQIARNESDVNQAIAGFRKALSIKPDRAEIHADMGNALRAQGSLDAAIESYTTSISLNSGDAVTHFNLGSALHEKGAMSAAIDCYRRALSLVPDFTEAQLNLGLAYQAQGELDTAIAHYRSAILLKDNEASLHINLGNTLQMKSRLAEAITSFQKAIFLKPLDPLAHGNLGNALRAQGRLEDAVESYRTSISLDSGSAVVHFNLGVTFEAQGKPVRAVACYQQALLLRPDFAEAHNGLGNALLADGKLAQAIESYRHALSLDPSLFITYNNLGCAYQVSGKLDEAIESYKHVLSLRSDYLEAHNNLLYVQTFNAKCSPDDYLAEANRYGNKILAIAKPYTNWHSTQVEQGTRRLRIGLVSGAFIMHPVGFFLENILSHLSPSKVELIAYSMNQADDALTARIKRYFTAWHSIVGLSDEIAAKKINDDGIDILIDLAGHTAQNRLPLFAWKPAPVQVSWMGYWASTGVPGMDFLIADPISVPHQNQSHFTETIWYLPDTRLCFTPPASGPSLSVAPLPALANNHITFGCFPSMSKVTEATLALWGRILCTLPNARLRLQSNQLNEAAAREQLLERLKRVGISPERITLEGPMSRPDYLSAHASVDIILDTFPYTGGTTTCEALWMGVPTVTLAGDSLLARQGVSLLSCVGLKNWIAVDEDDYVAKAVCHASDISQLALLRSGLRENVLSSPLFDARRFALHLEQALHDMWKTKRN